MKISACKPQSISLGVWCQGRANRSSGGWKLPGEWATACKYRRRRRTVHRGQAWNNCLWQPFSQAAFCGETAVVRSGGAGVGRADEFAGITDGLSVDVEDYFQVEAFAHRVPRSQWPAFPARVRQNTERVLRLLERNRCRATFFVLGWVAEREPSLVRDIVQSGHEVACHSHLHRRGHTLSPAEFREDVRRARGVIEDAAGVAVAGFRAPTFSITRQSLWALERLAELGF